MVEPKNSCDTAHGYGEFLSALLAVFPVDRGVASTDQVVFEPDSFLELLKAREVAIENYWTFCAEASNTDDVAVLLDAMLNDWIDLMFEPSPERLQFMQIRTSS